jgi:hypothetical protein
MGLGVSAGNRGPVHRFREPRRAAGVRFSAGSDLYGAGPAEPGRRQRRRSAGFGRPQRGSAGVGDLSSQRPPPPGPSSVSTSPRVSGSPVILLRVHPAKSSSLPGRTMDPQVLPIAVRGGNVPVAGQRLPVRARDDLPAALEMRPRWAISQTGSAPRKPSAAGSETANRRPPEDQLGESFRR